VWINRCQVLASTFAGVVGAALPDFAFPEGEIIKLGTIADSSGPLQPFGTQKLQCIQLAIEEINNSGGVLGREIELVSYDAQSDNQLYAADPETHHFIFDMHLAEVSNRKFEILQSFSRVHPRNPDDVCDLLKSTDTNRQFEPKL
jgi:hypothetical protein